MNVSVKNAARSLSCPRGGLLHRGTRLTHYKTIRPTCRPPTAPPQRPFSSSTRWRSIDSEQEARDRAAVGGPTTWKAGVAFALTGVGLYYYFTTEKAAVQARKAAEMAARKEGRPRVGGPFVLKDQFGKEVTEKILENNWSLIYFGFSNCPDICPEELDKMGEVVSVLEKEDKLLVQPIFISVDPARDSVEQVKQYISEFHPRMIGLTGDYDSVKKACKVYRVYFSTPPDAKPGDDYLVDHSIFFYLMDPKGEFVDAFGKITTAKDVIGKVRKAVAEW